jgi:hypothetical protein
MYYVGSIKDKSTRTNTRNDSVKHDEMFCFYAMGQSALSLTLTQPRVIRGYLI